MSKSIFAAIGWAGLVCVLLSGSALAEPEASLSSDLGESVSDTDLDDRRGGQDIEIDLNNIAELDSEVSRNSVGDGTVTGNISVTDNAFSDLSGIQANTFNTGNNVSIQTNMIVNLHME